MKHLRISAILLLVLYTSLVVEMNYHSHPKEHRVSVHCKICNFSQTFATQTTQIHLVVESSTIGTVAALDSTGCPLGLAQATSSRSPPLS